MQRADSALYLAKESGRDHRRLRPHRPRTGGQRSWYVRLPSTSRTWTITTPDSPSVTRHSKDRSGGRPAPRPPAVRPGPGIVERIGQPSIRSASTWG